MVSSFASSSDDVEEIREEDPVDPAAACDPDRCYVVRDRLEDIHLEVPVLEPAFPLWGGGRLRTKTQAGPRIPTRRPAGSPGRRGRHVGEIRDDD